MYVFNTEVLSRNYCCSGKH